MTKLLVLVALLAALAGAARGGVVRGPRGEADRVELPDVVGGPLPFRMYAGYINLNETTGKEMFYMLMEAPDQGDAPPRTLVEFIQGGPGCSSAISAFMETMFVPVDNPAQPDRPGVSWSPYAWNKLNGGVSMLYTDSPVGVGFSFSKTASDYQTDNNKTAHDKYVFYQRFMEAYPRYNQSDIVLSGESYAGDYVPQLAYRMLSGEDEGLRRQLKAIAVGNPVMSCQAWRDWSSTIQMELFYWHAMVPLSALTEWRASGCAVPNPPASPCNALYNKITDMVGPLDPDDMYTDPFTGNASLGVGPTPDRSIQTNVHAYLNRPDVQLALHARPTNWTSCCSEAGQSGSPCELNYTNNWVDMTPYYQYFFNEAPQMRVMIYSGDVDIATVPHAYTQLCIDSYNRTVTENWRPWVVDGQTAGYLTRYDGMDFATVKGAGHEVPLFQPRAAFELLTAFLAGRAPAGYQQ